MRSIAATLVLVITATHSGCTYLVSIPVADLKRVERGEVVSLKVAGPRQVEGTVLSIHQDAIVLQVDRRSEERVPFSDILEAALVKPDSVRTMFLGLAIVAATAPLLLLIYFILEANDDDA